MTGDATGDAAALILKIGDYPGHHGGLAAIRSLAGMGVETYVVVEHGRVPAAASAHAAGAFVWPTGSTNATGDHLIVALEEMATQLARPAVVVPTDDRAATLLNENAPRLPGGLLVPACPPGLCARLADKQSFAGHAERAGLSMPAQTMLHCPVPTGDVAALPLPLIVKRPAPGLRSDGSRTFSTVLIRDRRTLAEVLQDDDAGPYEVIVQEPIEGEDWLYHGYLDGGSQALVGFTGRKVRSWPPHAGETAFGVATANPPLREAVEAFLQAVGYAGPVGVDLRHDRRTGTYRILDANPRVCASFRMCVDARGNDVVRAMYLDLTGRPVPRSPQVEGRTYLVENYDWQARTAYGLDGVQGVVRWLRTMARADERAWFRLDDLPPVARRARMRPDDAGRGPIHPQPPHYVSRSRLRR